MNLSENFFESQFDPRIFSSVESLGYSTPTPIQEKAIPSIIEGHDLIGIAQTGTGKTAAFVLPILQRLMKGPRGRVRALIVVPTRELAEQVFKSFMSMGEKTGLRAVCLYGGMSLSHQIRTLNRGVEIVIACPGRLLDHIKRRTVRLENIEVLVLDEADHMFEMGFLPDVRRILKMLPSQRQSLLFSATMPTDIRHLVQEFLINPKTVQIGQSAPSHTVEQIMFPIAENLKSALLVKLLKDPKDISAIVFTKTKHRAKSLAEMLNEQLKTENRVVNSFQGNLTQNKRREVLDAFRRGSISILVATDIAARGIDIAHVTHVINFDMPATVDSYIHRIGRTGRAQRLGVAYTFVSPSERPRVRAIERVLNKKIEHRSLTDFDYKAAGTAIKAESSYNNPRKRTFGNNEGRSSDQREQFNSSANGEKNIAQGIISANLSLPPNNAELLIVETVVAIDNISYFLT